MIYGVHRSKQVEVIAWSRSIQEIQVLLIRQIQLFTILWWRRNHSLVLESNTPSIFSNVHETNTEEEKNYQEIGYYVANHTANVSRCLLFDHHERNDIVSNAVGDKVGSSVEDLFGIASDIVGD